MTSAFSKRLRAYQAQTFRTAPGRRIGNKDEAVSFVKERGFIFFWPIKNVTMPSLWVAAAGDRPVPDEHDDPGHITWGWKDELLGKRRWYYARILRKRGWIILLVGALTAAAAFGFSKLQTVEYKSTIQTFVRPERIDNGTLLATKAILRGFVRFIDSRDFAARVINSLKLDMLPEALINKVTIASIDEDYIIQIDVIDTNGDQANDIAREWATQFVLWRQQDNANQLKQDRVDANIVQDPTYVQFRPQTGLNTAAGGIIGLMIGALIVFFLESIESNILRGPDDVERALSMTVLSAIPVTSAEENRARKKSASMISKPASLPLLQSPNILDRERSQRHDPDE